MNVREPLEVELTTILARSKDLALEVWADNFLFQYAHTQKMFAILLRMRTTIRALHLSLGSRASVPVPFQGPNSWLSMPILSLQELIVRVGSREHDAQATVALIPEDFGRGNPSVKLLGLKRVLTPLSEFLRLQQVTLNRAEDILDAIEGSPDIEVLSLASIQYRSSNDPPRRRVMCSQLNHLHLAHFPEAAEYAHILESIVAPPNLFTQIEAYVDRYAEDFAAILPDNAESLKNFATAWHLALCTGREHVGGRLGVAH
ncbi:hypothetical protein BOTBODRAFT_189959 [Botryobasidium botryosum FD-172 SS1]|uniref:Uncharacterized protein n=1 Tax=Botryobasidium botryosum (strain FD-172 SS1) TaxID=930990 RepID=A0A067MI21_BOTB1|nr:hypothetical protein BOTBODRAFT_189959 [Botryobasidium botryosum FD-172 SS1]